MIFQLCDLYENDSIFDKFECCLSGDGLRVATGSYRSVSYVCSLFHCYYGLLEFIMMLSPVAHEPAIYSACLVLPQEVLNPQPWKLAKTQWGNFTERIELVMTKIMILIVLWSYEICYALLGDKFRLLQGHPDPSAV